MYGSSGIEQQGGCFVSARQEECKGHARAAGLMPGIGHIVCEAIVGSQAKLLNDEGLVQGSSLGGSWLDEVVIHPGVVVSVAYRAVVDPNGFRVDVQAAKADVCNGCVEGIAPLSCPCRIQ